MRTRKLTANTTSAPVSETKPNMIVMSELVSRMLLGAKMGMQYGDSRNVYQALGYPEQTELNYATYYGKYIRHDMAKAIIDRPVKASWKGKITVIENSKKQETEFEKAWRELDKKLQLKSVFIRADKLTGLGRYSVILLGLDDTLQIEDYLVPAKKNSKLLYVKPLSENSAKIDTFEDDPTNERYGLPVIYNINIQKLSSSGATVSASLRVHYTRVIHLVEDINEDEVYGTPRLEVVYNRLLDLEKLVGGDAEMFWRGARPGYTGTVKDDYQMTSQALKDLQSQIDEFEHHLRRVLINEGVDYKAFEQQIADPLNHVDVQMQMISAVTGIPKRILIGSERGELSSAQDKQEWIAYITSRREEQNEPMILRPFINRCIEIGILPKPKDGNYTIVWDKLFSLSDAEKVNMGKVRAIAFKEYTANPYAESFMPFDLFLEMFMFLDEAQIEKIKERQGEVPKIERPLTPEEAALMKTRSGRDYRISTGETFDIDEYSDHK